LLKCDDIKELYPDIEVIDEGWVSDTDTVRRVDLILKIGQEKHLIEIKTSDKNQIKYIQNQNIWQEKRKDVLQLLDYYFALTKGGDTISTARLFYISEDLSWKLECGISPDRYKAEWETEVNNVKKVVLEDIVPPAQWCWTCYNKKSGKAYCQYIEHCFEALNIKWENDKKVNVQERKDGQNGSNSNQNISKRR
jgi:CRISPR/Cas system-associated exonuclease Cas4 (RecB family)